MHIRLAKENSHGWQILFKSTNADARRAIRCRDEHEMHIQTQDSSICKNSYHMHFYESRCSPQLQQQHSVKTSAEKWDSIGVGYRLLHQHKVQTRIARPSFLGAAAALFPGKAVRETSTRALKLYGSCMDISERTFLFSWMFSFINPCMKFP